MYFNAECRTIGIKVIIVGDMVIRLPKSIYAVHLPLMNMLCSVFLTRAGVAASARSKQLVTKCLSVAHPAMAL